MRSRIVGLAVAATVLAITLFGVPLAVAVFSYAMQVERSQLERVADAVAITIAADVYEQHQVDGFEEIDGPSYVDVTLYDEDGDWLAGAWPGIDRLDGQEPELAQALGGGVGWGTDDGDLSVVVPVTHADEVIGAAQATAPRSAVLAKVAPVWAAMAALAALAVATTWLLGHRQARRLALPLEGLAVAARRLGDGDFSVRTRRGGVPEIDAVGSALDSTAARLDDLLARERAFAADASHQPRTPLTGLRLRLEAAAERPDRDARPAVAATLPDTDRLQATFEELLALTRDPRAHRAYPIDLTVLLEDLAPEWRSRLALQGRHLDVRITPGTPDPCASAAAVRQVLAALVDSATTHGTGTVTVTAREAPGAVAIDVATEGPGVQEPEGVLVARPADQPDGHDIGLTLARRLVEAEGGRLELTRPSPPAFTLLLPWAIEEAPTEPLTPVVASPDGDWRGSPPESDVPPPPVITTRS
ncbi:MAG TPA: HAMP domain-containing sensor histidine kinase [Geodermatophilus sp.]|nr:HAMP domain-containing sensor histidine kinase [Geodermatophilus sp.]